MIKINAPSSDEFRKGYMAFQQHERRDAMYKTATTSRSVGLKRPSRQCLIYLRDADSQD